MEVFQGHHNEVCIVNLSISYCTIFPKEAIRDVPKRFATKIAVIELVSNVKNKLHKNKSI